VSKWTKAEQAEHRAELVADLRTEGLRQVTGSLRSPAGILNPSEGDGFCCLGRACEVAAKQGITERAPSNSSWSGYSTLVLDPAGNGEATYDNGYLPNEVREFYGFTTRKGQLRTRIETEDFAATTLADLNDGLGWSFAQIADLIEADGVELTS
jgi:hypothetical protein